MIKSTKLSHGLYSEFYMGQIVMTVHCQGSDVAAVACTSVSTPLPFVPVCSCGQPLHRSPEGRLFDISFESWRHISLFPPSSHLLSFTVHPWSLCLPGHLMFWPRVIPPCSLHLSVSLSLLWGERCSGAEKKRLLHAVTMATASRSWASTLVQTCVLALSFSLLLPYLD